MKNFVSVWVTVPLQGRTWNREAEFFNQVMALSGLLFASKIYSCLELNIIDGIIGIAIVISPNVYKKLIGEFAIGYGFHMHRWTKMQTIISLSSIQSHVEPKPLPHGALSRRRMIWTMYHDFYSCWWWSDDAIVKYVGCQRRGSFFVPYACIQQDCIE